LKELIKIVM